MDESKNRQPVASGDKKRNGDADRDQIRQPGSMCGNLTHHPVYPIDVEHCLKAKQAGQMPRPDRKMQNRSQQNQLSHTLTQLSQVGNHLLLNTLSHVRR